MSTDNLPASWPELVQQWHAAMAYISEKTSSLPVSQVVSSLSDWLDLLLNPALSQEMREDQLHDLQQLFTRRWEIGAMHMMSGQTKQMSQQILLDPSTDITQGKKPYGKDLAHAFWSAVAALQSDAPTVEAPDILPPHDDLRAHVRMMATRWGRFYLPVISYAPLVDTEWQAILQELPKLVDVTLAVEGVSLLWLLGTFVRDQTGRISLQPELSYQRAGPGTRIKSLRLILGTEYQKHGQWLGELAKAVEERQHKTHDDLVAQISLHCVTVQLFPGVGDYVLYDPEKLNSVEREISNRVSQAERKPRQKPVILLEGEYDEPELREPLPTPVSEPVADMAATPLAASLRPPTSQDLTQDAEWLRQKGQLALEQDKSLAKKYLLASTMLDNSSVDVWMTLSRLASSEKEKSAFLREAQKVMKREQR
jgi:hypothetical protein